MGSLAAFAVFQDDCEAHAYVSSLNPACLRMGLSVLLGMSVLGLPATVTNPGFAGCVS